MSAVAEEAFNHSERLEEQWERLKLDMRAVDQSAPDAAKRMVVVQQQMDQVRTEMALVLDQTRRLLPPATGVVDLDEAAAPAPPVQYSVNGKHVIGRVYDSSDTSQEDDQWLALNRSQTSSSPYTPSVMRSSLPCPPLCPPDNFESAATPPSTPKITTESKKVVSLAGFTRGILEKLRIGDGDSKANRSDASALMGSSHFSPDQVRKEQTQLELEARNLKRKPDCGPQDEARLVQISTKLSELSKHHPVDLAHDNDCDDSNRAEEKPLTNKDMLFSPLTQSDENDSFGNQSEMAAPVSARQKKNAQPKRKKGWAPLESGVASFRALGRTVRNAASSASSRAADQRAPQKMSSRFREESKNVQATESVLAETNARLKKRGEALGSLAESSEQMNEDADSMLEAARALRQRKTGRFF